MTNEQNVRQVSPALQAAIDHMESQERTVIDVPEWGFQIYCPPLTMKDKQLLDKRSKGDAYEMAVYALILKAENEQREKLFTLNDKNSLMTSISGSVVERIFVQMMGAETQEQIEKNS